MVLQEGNFNITFKGENFNLKLNGLTYSLHLEELQKLHSSVLFYMLLDCTDCFCGNDTLPGKLTES